MDIPAIHDKDLISILEELDLLKKIETKKIKCSNCNQLITVNSLGALKKEKEEILIICDNPECIASQSLKLE